MPAPILNHFVNFFYDSIHNLVVVTDNKTWLFDMCQLLTVLPQSLKPIQCETFRRDG